MHIFNGLVSILFYLSFYVLSSNPYHIFYELAFMFLLLWQEIISIFCVKHKIVCYFISFEVILVSIIVSYSVLFNFSTSEVCQLLGAVKGTKEIKVFIYFFFFSSTTLLYLFYSTYLSHYVLLKCYLLLLIIYSASVSWALIVSLIYYFVLTMIML